jgi:type VI protein secretion system component VasF
MSDAAFEAAAKACPFVNRDAIRRIVEAAAPHIAAVQRERLAAGEAAREALARRVRRALQAYDSERSWRGHDAAASRCVDAILAAAEQAMTDGPGKDVTA